MRSKRPRQAQANVSFQSIILAPQPATQSTVSGGRRCAFPPYALLYSLLGIPALAVGAAAISSAATQFVAYRVGYHPALGAPWIGHFYAPWSWVQWQQAPCAPDAETTFRIVDSALMAMATLGVLAVMCISTARRRRPIRHEGVHGTALFQTELEIRRNGLLPRGGRPSAGVYVGGWTDPRGRTHYLRHDGPEHCSVIAPTRSGKGVENGAARTNSLAGSELTGSAARTCIF